MSLADKLQRIAAQRAVKARVGILEDKTYPDGAGVAEVGYMNEYGTIKNGKQFIPPRPFFRQAIADNRKLLPSMAAKLLKTHDAETVMRLLCEHITDALKMSVMTWTTPENAESTQKIKGYDAPLRGPDRLLRNSFSYEINPDD